jgi:hypothetical protein
MYFENLIFIRVGLPGTKVICQVYRNTAGIPIFKIVQMSCAGKFRRLSIKWNQCQ